ncbi:putative bifunctional diguanylate cyclase/phosphodiesterase [Ningiella sp. W23]|uniref:putative bifunctional diguanylate cyclase/phosphodiesterase n=1 Tax=Ningiella sp. W23 TaxID=3023715 RepID=UPI0037564F20
MKRFTHIHFISALCITSVVLLLCYVFGAFEIRENAFKSNIIKGVHQVYQGGTLSDVTMRDSLVDVICIFPNQNPDPFCGASLHTHEKVGTGVDLSNYTAIELRIRKRSDHDNQKVKLSLKNFNPSYSTLEDYTSHKFNSVEFYLDQEDETYVVPLDYFQVESWWQTRYNVEFDTAQPELTNVQTFELIWKDPSPKSVYRLEITDVVLHGELLELNHILGIIITIMVLVIFLLVDRQRANQRLTSFIDPLTKLLNRRGLVDWLERKIGHNAQERSLAVLYMDIDDFKHTNDSYGHYVGDLLLKAFCKSVNECIKSSHSAINRGKLVRLSGDEFIVVAVDVDSEDATALGEAVLKRLVTPIKLDGNPIKINVSMGVASMYMSTPDTKEIFRQADAAMYFAKKRGKNQVKAYDESVEKEQTNRQKTADKVLHAINNDELALQFMPIFDTDKKQVTQVEVLRKIASPRLPDFSEEELASIATEFSLHEQLDAWVLKKTLRYLSQYSSELDLLGLKFCINVSASELQDRHFSDYLLTLIEQYQVAPSSLCIEISEINTMADHDNVVIAFNALHQAGLTLTIDKFGSSHTILSHLIEYPIDSIKIDRRLIEGLNTAQDSDNSNDYIKAQGLIKSLIGFAKNCQFQCIADGVDTLEQFYLLEKLQCDLIQGYLFSEPLSFEELMQGLKSQLNTTL